MSTLKTPFRYDFVGSFLRPEKFKAAKAAFEEGKISQDELDRVTDECVTEIVKKQKTSWLPCDHRWGIQKKILASGFYVGI